MKLSAGVLLLAIMGIADHKRISGKLWDWNQTWHHEPFVMALASFGIGLLINRGKPINRR